MKIEVFTDGGSLKNPGPSAIGIVILKEGKIWKTYKKYIGRGTNNEAEYKAVIYALLKLKLLLGKKRAKKEKIVIKTDSRLLFSQLLGKWKIKNKNLQKLFLKIWNLKPDFKEVKFSLIKRRENIKADRLTREILKKKT